MSSIGIKLRRAEIDTRWLVNTWAEATIIILRHANDILIKLSTYDILYVAHRWDPSRANEYYHTSWLLLSQIFICMHVGCLRKTNDSVHCHKRVITGPKSNMWNRVVQVAVATLSRSQPFTTSREALSDILQSADSWSCLTPLGRSICLMQNPTSWILSPVPGQVRL